MTKRIKPYEDLEFTDDFMFAVVMRNNPQICKQVIELILGRKIKDISYLDYQHCIAIRYDARGVRLDVTAMAVDGTVFDLEMQVRDEKNLPKRCRYYHGMLSLEQVERGGSYRDLRETYVVFIMKNGLGPEMKKPVYIFENYCKDSDIQLKDGARTVFLNATCDTEELTEELKAFVRYIRSGSRDVDDNLVTTIEDSVEKARDNLKWRA